MTSTAILFLFNIAYADVALVTPEMSAPTPATESPSLSLPINRWSTLRPTDAPPFSMIELMPGRGEQPWFHVATVVRFPAAEPPSFHWQVTPEVWKLENAPRLEEPAPSWTEADWRRGPSDLNLCAADPSCRGDVYARW